MMTEKLKQTPSQTVGPFFGFALPYLGGPELVPPHSPGSVRFHGTVCDGEGEPVDDAIVEIWQPDREGNIAATLGSLQRDGYTFTGFGRAAVSQKGSFSFTTLKPGAARAGSAPYILVTVFARGLLHHLFTRAYFSDEAELNAADPFLAALDSARAATLIAQRESATSYRFDLRLQGQNETVFIDYLSDPSNG